MRIMTGLHGNVCFYLVLAPVHNSLKETFYKHEINKRLSFALRLSTKVSHRLNT